MKIIFLSLLIALPMLLSAQVCASRSVSSFVKPSGGYTTSGTAILEEHSNGTLTLSFSAAFSTSSGPDLYVYLAERDDAPTASGNGHIELAALINNNGTQSYNLPANVSIEDYDYVLVHCKQYNHFWTWGQLSATTGSCAITGTVNQNQDFNLKVYPNPAVSAVNISFEQDAQIKIFNNLGQQLLQQAHLAGISNIEVSSLPKGMYWVELQSESNRAVTRLVVE